MGSSLVGIAFFVGILEVCFLYKVVWESVYVSGGSIVLILRTKWFGEVSMTRDAV